MNWLNKALTYIKKGYSSNISYLKHRLNNIDWPKKNLTFQRRNVPKNERFIYKLYHSIKSSTLKRFAPVLNHSQFDEIKDLMIDLVFTGLVLWFITWALFFKTSPRMAFGIAVTISVVQYYIKWYYTIRPRTFTEVHMKK